jgi:hypothetical protein
MTDPDDDWDALTRLAMQLLEADFIDRCEAKLVELMPEEAYDRLRTQLGEIHPDLTEEDLDHLMGRTYAARVRMVADLAKPPHR